MISSNKHLFYLLEHILYTHMTVKTIHTFIWLHNSQANNSVEELLVKIAQHDYQICWRTTSMSSQFFHDFHLAQRQHQHDIDRPAWIELIRNYFQTIYFWPLNKHHQHMAIHDWYLNILIYFQKHIPNKNIYLSLANPDATDYLTRDKHFPKHQLETVYVQLHYNRQLYENNKNRLVPEDALLFQRLHFELVVVYSISV